MDQVKQLKKYQVLNSNVIKYIAIIAMTIDHLTWAFFPGFNLNPIAIIGHIIGRLTMPIMCYSMVEGYMHTKSFKKYLTRLLIFAFISQIPFRLNSFIVPFKGWKSFVPFMDGSVFNQFNVLFGLAGGLVLIKIFDTEKFKQYQKILLMIVVLAITFPCDYSCITSIIILFMWFNRNSFKKQMLWMMIFFAIYSIVYIFAINLQYGFIQLATALSIPILLMYNGQRGKNVTFNKINKWFFYIYYPLHLLILGLLLYFKVLPIF